MPTRVTSAEHGGTFWTQAQALKTVFDRDPHLAPVEVLASPGASVETAERLAGGAAELGFMAANWVPRAARGEAPFATKLDLRIVAPMNAGPLFFIVRADSLLKTVADLAGKRVVFGPEKSGMTQHARTILGLLGIAATPVYLDFVAGGAAVESGAAEAQLQCPIPNHAMTALDERAVLRVLPYPAGTLERVLGAMPYYRRATMRQGSLRCIDRDVAQPGVLNLLVARATASDDITYAAARAIVENANELVRLNALFNGLDALFLELRTRGSAALATNEVPLHPGAERAYRALGILA